MDEQREVPVRPRGRAPGVAYAIDRDAIVKRLFGDLGVNKAVQTLNPPILAKYSDTTAWSSYTLNSTRSTADDR